MGEAFGLPLSFIISIMGRRLLIAVMLVAVSGMVPLMAHAGSCNAMPCCHKSGTSVAANGGCCQPTTCSRDDQALRTTTRVIVAAALRAPVVMTAQFRPTPILRPALLSPSPPLSTSQRLSALSTLLI